MEMPQPSRDWIKEQDVLRRRVVAGDEFAWAWGDEVEAAPPLRYVGGVDVSFLEEDSSVACGTLVIVDLRQEAGLPVIYEVHQIVRLRVPYVPGFLAFREAPLLLGLLEKIKSEAPSLYPQVLMVDGNGILHPRGIGLASHLGVLANLPTVGVGKNLHRVDGLTLSRVKELLLRPENSSGDMVQLVGDTGTVWGAATRFSPGCSKSVFISIGHRLSLESCLRLVRTCSKYRVPEPIRQADIRSRRHLRSRRETAAECLRDEPLEIISPRSMSLVDYR